jgi:hypothetical protein
VRYRPTKEAKRPSSLIFHPPYPGGPAAAHVQEVEGMTSLRAAASAALLLALTACTATVPLDVSREVTLQSPAGAFSSQQAVDLSTAGEVWSRRDKIDAVSVDEIVATVVSVGAGHQAASTSLAVAFRADGAPADGSRDLHAGTLSNLSLAAGQSVRIPGSAALDAFLLDALKGSGRFTVLGSGSLAGAANAVIRIELKGSAAYKIAGK